MLIAGFSDGTAKAFRLLSAHGTDAARDSSSKNAFRVPDNTHFLHAATFINPASQEAVAFVAARPTTDGCAAVLLIGNNGGRSLFSTSAPSIDLQPWHHRQLPQDYLYPSAMLWPLASKTIITSDSGSCSVEEMDVLTGKSALQLRSQCSQLHFHSAQAIPAAHSSPFPISSGPWTWHFRRANSSAIACR